MSSKWYKVIGVAIAIFAITAGSVAVKNLLQPSNNPSAASEPCDEATAIWNRSVDPNSGSDLAAATTPVEAVRRFGEVQGLVITPISETGQPVEAGGSVEVASESGGQDGRYSVMDTGEGWVVTGGQGCGAPGPLVPTCPTPTPSTPAEAGTTYRMTC